MEKLTFGLGVMALGMVVVFAGLFILIGFIKILGMAANAGSQKKKINSNEAPKAAAPSVSAAPVVEAGIPADVVAAITAAIATVWQGESGFVVRHIRHINNAPVWNRAGREEQTYSRF